LRISGKSVRHFLTGVEWDGFRKGVDLAENHLFLARNRLPKIRKKINFLLESFSKNRIKYLEILRQRGFVVVRMIPIFRN